MTRIIGDTIRRAGYKVKRGAVYFHYKDRAQFYRVERLGFNVENEKVMVIYTSYVGEEEITWVRSLDSWLELVDGNEPRFQRIE